MPKQPVHQGTAKTVRDALHCRRASAALVHSL